MLDLMLPKSTGGIISEFQIPLLRRTAVCYKQTNGSDKVLFDLAIEERNLFEPLLRHKV